MINDSDPKKSAATKASSFEPEGVSVLKNSLKNLPQGPGVYHMIGERAQILYIGKAKNLRKRVTNYTLFAKLPTRLKRMVRSVKSLEITTTNTEVDALILEARLIRKHRPNYNILLKDDKSFPYILIAKDHPYPQILSHRGEKSRPGDYFGPYPSAGNVHETLPMLQRAFLLRSCTDQVFKDRDRPCLLYHIKRCSAPCVGKISEPDYARLVEDARAFLLNKSRTLQKDLIKKMEEASQALDFESAAVFRDRIRALGAIQRQHELESHIFERADVIALYCEGGRACIQVFLYDQGMNLGNRPYFFPFEEDDSIDEILQSFLIQFYQQHEVPPLILLSHPLEELSVLTDAFSQIRGSRTRIETPKLGTKALIAKNARQNASQALHRHLSERTTQKQIFERLSEILKLPDIPTRIEVYDNSHLQGTHPYGVMIVVNQEGFQKNSYRKFKIKDVNNTMMPGDDYAMMREVLTRRLKPLLAVEEYDTQIPDLILIDGGKGQLSSVVSVITELGIQGIEIAAISKGPERNKGNETFHRPDMAPFHLQSDDPVLYFLQQIRDEAHRFAITTHRNKRTKALAKSKLDEIIGIGSKRKKALLQHFGSAREVESASLQDLSKVPGISDFTARKIYEYFHT